MRRQNGITIEDVMKMECMSKCKLIAGLQGSRNTVSRVNIMADPDILNWVDSGELLLTTAYSFKKDDVETQKKLIRECAQKGLAGIGIKIYPYLESISQEVVELADMLNFPIIDLYYGTPFSDIMTPIFMEIFNKQASLLQRLEKVHEQLMKVVLSGGKIQDVGMVIYENLRNPVIIRLEFTNEIIMELGDVEEETRVFLLENFSDYYEYNKGKKIKKRKFEETIETIEGKHITRMVMPIVVKNNVYGHIFSWAMETPLGGFDLSVLETASTTIALEILKQISVRDVENRYRAEFLEDLLSLDKNRKEKALERADVFKLKLDEGYIMVVIQLESQTTIVTDEILKTIALINSDIETLVKELNLKAFIANKTDSINVLLTFSGKNKLQTSTQNFCEFLEKNLEQRLKEKHYKIGIGRPYFGLGEVYKSYIDAIKAIENGELIGEKKTAYFEKMGIYKILCQDSLQEELERFYEATILPLVEYDSKRSAELVKTLDMYFQSNGNLKKLSEDLFTHYNTTLYRIQRIQKITGMNLENHKDRLNLEIAIKIKKLLKK
ncbi:transcriptional regulator, CdaR family [Natronincola peptidivorans]|uniref:Transcriptional regulator, CdaR family n=1 Tax=Natronincola peptidivorans TaxID=426128 RepID=A0A1I0F451_9FIRM|nr:PucR family transcriptional regulator [Natronincola peptidivorans]SET52599.1 transcriptional regulator, CdaR family [Natronincola peptidivorans]